MRILHIIRTNGIAGAESHVFSLLPHLVTRGHCVSLLCYSDRFCEKTSLANLNRELKRMELAGVKVIRETTNNKNDLFQIFNTISILKNINPDIVHTHMPFADLVGSVSSKVLGHVVVASRHRDYGLSKQDIKKFSRYYRIANRFIDRMIVISNCIGKLIEKHERYSPEHVTIIPYGAEDVRVDKVQARAALVSEFGFSDDVIIVGTVARLIPLKGHRYGATAIAKALEFFPKIKWIVVGSGEEYEPMKKQALELGIDSAVIFAGFRNDVNKLMASFDILLHPTLAEGFGLVQLEAMIQSTPIVSTTAGAISEVVENGVSGLLAQPSNSDQLAEHLVRLCKNIDEAKMMGIAGRKIFENKFTLNDMVDKIEAVYFEIQGEKR